MLVRRVAAARGPFDAVGRCQHPRPHGPKESVQVPCPAVLGEEEPKPSRSVAEAGETLGFDDVASMERNPGERGEREIPLQADRGREVPVEEADEVSLVIPGRVVRRSVVLPDNQARVPPAALAPNSVSRRNEVCHGRVVGLQPARDLNQRIVGVHPGRPGPTCAHRVARQEGQHLSPLVVGAELPRGLHKTHPLEILQQAVHRRRPRPSCPTHRVTDPDCTAGIPTLERLLHVRQFASWARSGRRPSSGRRTAADRPLGLLRLVLSTFNRASEATPALG